MKLLLLLLFLTTSAYSYPNYIGYGYKTCLNCHYNPYGSGPLTDYGRAVSAAEIAGRLFWPKKYTDEQIAEKSAFAPGLPKWFRPSLSYRGLYLYNEQQYIPMDLSTAVVAKFLDKDRLTFVLELGYLQQYEKFKSREHYAGFRVTKELGIFVGLMDKAFGIRVPDHIAFSRSYTGITQHAQSHGILFHSANDIIEVGVHPFVGNLIDELPDERQRGVSLIAEGEIKDHKIGGSYLESKSEVSGKTARALHARFAIPKGHSVLMELGNTFDTNAENYLIGSSVYGFNQAHILLTRGLWSILTWEWVALSTGKNIRLGPGVQYFPMQRIELRSDAYYNYQYSDNENIAFWTFASQLHIWL